ncbi:MAG: hypothetical protein SX243_00165 [Acidobacteriota bacterium]|nr:hypothetical protein [Acidobacteriota bacterium]
MAVYDRGYKRFDGELTEPLARFLVIPRYAFRTVFASRLFLAFFILSLVPPVIGALVIYLRYNASFLQTFNLQIADLLVIDERFFDALLHSQGSLAFFVTLFVAPALMSADLRNNALPLYLSRPFSRLEYLLGKASVLVVLLSVLTWIPLLGLWVLQAYLEDGWAGRFAWLPLNLLVACGLFLVLLILLGLAISAWLQQKALARLTLFAYYFVSIAVAAVVNLIFSRAMDTPWGDLLSLPASVDAVWSALLRTSSVSGLPAWAGALSLIAVSALCALLLVRKVRAYEVVR